MFSHDQIWAGIDRLALSHGLSPSALARRAGLDPTSLNRSKRFTREGRPRWPSTSSIAKLLHATGVPLEEFAALVGAAATPDSPAQPASRPESACEIKARVSSTP